jgi:hypothetical protein
MAEQLYATRIGGGISAAFDGLANFVVVRGSITKVTLLAGGDNTNGDHTFDIKLNGATISEDIKILSGTVLSITDIAKGSVLTTEGQEMRFDLTSAALGGIPDSLWIQIIVDTSMNPQQWLNDLYFPISILSGVDRPTGSEMTTGVAALLADPTPLGVRNVALTLAQSVLEGSEYIAFSRTDSQYVDDLYRGLLGRLASEDPDGHDFWLATLATQGGDKSRDDLLKAFVFSVESLNDRLNGMSPTSLPVGDAKFFSGVPIKDGDVPNNGDTVTFASARSQFEFINPVAFLGQAYQGTWSSATAYVSGTDGYS